MAVLIAAIFWFFFLMFMLIRHCTINNKFNTKPTFDSNGNYHSYNDRPSDYTMSYCGSLLIRYWHKHGVLHREMGPSISKELVCDKPLHSWYINGKLVTSKEKQKPIKECQRGEMFVLHEDNKVWKFREVYNNESAVIEDFNGNLKQISLKIEDNQDRLVYV